MKFSNETVAILKNFSRFNSGIMFREGQKLKTLDEYKTIVCEADIAETIPRDAGVHDIGRFLSTMSLMDDPDIDFKDNYFEIKSDRSVVKYTYTSENMIFAPPPDRKMITPEALVTINVPYHVLESVTRAADVLSVPEISFKARDSVVTLLSVDTKNPTADSFSVELTHGVECPDFEMVFKKDFFRLLALDYDVSVWNGGAHFNSGVVQYWVAAQPMG